LAIQRYEPGRAVTRSGMYALVGHFGEPVGVAAWFDQGAKLPLTVVSEEIAYPLWFVQIGDEAEASGLLAA
jgi:hypothetical protein